MPFAIKPKQTVLFIGDSITDCGRRAAAAPLGNGYVQQVRDLIVAKYPKHQLNIINKGIGGNTVEDLYNRWSDDVTPFKPDWISIKIGINDLHQHMRKNERAVSPEKYEQLYDQIITRAKKETKSKVVLVDPFYISTDRRPTSERHTVSKLLKSYLRVVDRLAKRHKTKRVKTHDAYQTLLKFYPADQFCPEPVHPYPSGHLVIATEWLKAVGW